MIACSMMSEFDIFRREVNHLYYYIWPKNYFIKKLLNCFGRRDEYELVLFWLYTSLLKLEREEKKRWIEREEEEND